jgi:dipeptidyl aminopeptidase/acylaminoacyl peptidase
MHRGALPGVWALIAVMFVSAAVAERHVTIEDLSALRRIDTLRLSPDHAKFAILVRHADVPANSYRLSWFVGSAAGGALVPVGDGGDARLAVGLAQSYGGAFERPAVRWSPDGRWIAYTVSRAGEVQLWRSRTHGGAQEQLTHNAADVRNFEWSNDGESLFFTVGSSRAKLRAREEAKERAGYHYDTDLRGFTVLMAPRAPPPDKDAALWVVGARGRGERLASETEREEFTRAQGLSGASIERFDRARKGAFAERADGALARAAIDATKLFSRMQVSLPGVSDPVVCEAAECGGYIDSVWWGDRNTVLFLRHEGLAGAATGLYAWTPENGRVIAVIRTLDDVLTSCDAAAARRLICVRETPSLPPHVAAIDYGTGAVVTVGDVNPAFADITLGNVERFEWDTPKFQWSEPGGAYAGVYPPRTYGYILYPPAFDPTRQYPVFISPYSAAGFDNATNQEYALHALAANGFVVLSTNFPTGSPEAMVRYGEKYIQLAYSADLGFPHLSMYMESTVRALDTVAARGFIDEQRVGIGGVSHGAFVPLYLVQKYDRIAAVAVSGGSWSRDEYYWPTPLGRASLGVMGNWMMKPVGPGLDFWKQIDLADNVETIEAPILINVPAHETYSLTRLLNHMTEAGKPYDAYVFPMETHLKWQAAHLDAIMRRNLDWFRFWLQSHEDPDPDKAEQYSRWRKLRELRDTDRARAGSAPAATRSPPPGR